MNKNVVLSWEKGHPNRTEWTAELIARIEEYWPSFDKVTDGHIFYDNYASLTKEQKIKVLAVMFEWTAYYESGWNPASAGVDVGEAKNKDTWSVGLLQLSVCDQPNLGIHLNYTFEDLQNPIKNLHLGVAIMAHQIEKRGVLCIAAGHPGLYWATLHPGGKYDKTPVIAAHTRTVTVP